MNKQYFTYLCKQNKGFIILSHFIAFVVIFLVRTVDKSAYYYIEPTLAIAYLLGCFYTFLAPIYLFSFIQKKTSAQTYFSLPIKRETLFTTTALFSLIISITPIIIWTLLTVLVNNALGMLIAGELLTMCMIGLVALFAIYAMSLCICQLCTNVLDSLVCNGAYVVLPALIYLAMQSFLYNCLENIVKGQGNYLRDIDNFIYFISPGVTGLAVGAGQLGTIAAIYWFIVACALVFFAYRLFVGRKAETAENYTKSVWIYPVIMSLVTFSLLIIVFDQFIWVAMVFVIYLLMYFFWKRKVTFNVKIPAVFIAMVIVTFGFQKAFIATEGFGLIQEVPSLRHVSAVKIEVVNPMNEKISFEYNAIEKDEVLKTHQFHQALVDSKETRYAQGGYEFDNATFWVHMTYFDEGYSQYWYTYVTDDAKLVQNYVQDTFNQTLDINDFIESEE